MDNEQVREWLARNAQEEKGTFNRVTIERLLADSEAYAKLRAEIAGLAVGFWDEAMPAYVCLPANWLEVVKGWTNWQRVALLRLPAGEPGESA